MKLLLSTLVKSTCSLKVNTNLSTVPSKLLSLVTADTRVGTLVSTINALLCPKELGSPGVAKVKVAAFNAASLIVPLFNAKELVDS